PWNWGEHEGVVHEGGHYRVKRFEALEQAWQAQAAHEKTEEEAVVAKREEGATSGSSSTSSPPATPAGPTPTATQEQSAAAPAGPSPVEKQRALIRDFMEQHGTLAVGHPFATGCAGCRHFLDNSPTKDETVPHCAWADRPRRVYFQVLRPVQNK